VIKFQCLAKGSRVFPNELILFTKNTVNNKNL
jgi:hypothetical protein